MVDAVGRLLQENAFLDSSIIISREFGSSSLKRKIEESLAERDKFSTTYAKTEINRTFLKDAIFLHSLLVEEKDLTVVFKRLQSFPLTPGRRKRCLELLSKISNKRQLRIADSITRLENLIVGLYSLLLKDVLLIRGGTGCPLANEKVEFVPPVFRINTSCTRILPSCKIEYFIKTNRHSLEKIHNHIEKYPNLKELTYLIKEILRDAKVAKGRNCMTLGDTIICLDSPEDYTIFSTNIKDFEPICRSLGKKFVGIK